MDKRIIIAAAVVLLAAGGGTAYFAFRPDNQTDKQETTQQDTGKKETPAADETPAPGDEGLTGGSYADYEDGIIAKTAGTKILFFHDAGNTLSRTLDADIKAQGIPKGTTVIKVDYGTGADLRGQYGVTQPATFIRVYDNGIAAKTFMASVGSTISTVLGYLL